MVILLSAGAAGQPEAAVPAGGDDHARVQAHCRGVPLLGGVHTGEHPGGCELSTLQLMVLLNIGDTVPARESLRDEHKQHAVTPLLQFLA